MISVYAKQIMAGSLSEYSQKKENFLMTILLEIPQPPKDFMSKNQLLEKVFFYPTCTLPTPV